jgi:NhaP-type Na+/H+ or K+/H+ antiporter
MNPRYALALKLTGAVVLIIVLAVAFLPFMEGLEAAGRELRYVWWVLLLLALAVWLIWGLGRKKK